MSQSGRDAPDLSEYGQLVRGLAVTIEAPEQTERFTDDLRATTNHIQESPRLFGTVHGDVR